MPFVQPYWKESVISLILLVVVVVLDLAIPRLLQRIIDQGILAAILVLKFWLALASVVVAPIMFWFTDYIARYTRRGYRDLQRDLGQINAVMEDAISGWSKLSGGMRRRSCNSRLTTRPSTARQSMPIPTPCC
jgi:ABC-type multidrug transport system fused ATPase/permease subunit